MTMKQEKTSFSPESDEESAEEEQEEDLLEVERILENNMELVKSHVQEAKEMRELCDEKTQ